ncbi:MAG: tRNA (adenosine(37)-N6)-threonylcarbamoyltransferase complex dimerization subunit type 1 TsaB [Burkholderiales bacterium]
MKLLAFDTSTHWLTVACCDGARWTEREELAGQAHSQRLIPVVDEVLREANLDLRDLDAIAFGAGPGSFTGVRIACGVAQGLALGAGVRLAPVSTLEAVAQSAWEIHGWPRVLACLDARMREVYVAAFRRDGAAWFAEREPSVCKPDDAIALGGEWKGAGDGFAAYPDLAAQLGLGAVDAATIPRARAVAAIASLRVGSGVTVPASEALPLYVRHRVALTTAEREAGARL